MQRYTLIGLIEKKKQNDLNDEETEIIKFLLNNKKICEPIREIDDRRK